tara:strand:- start:1858 stop:2346 length:489 start_codon:yes stop_codon:yes gene_type:complete
MTEEIVDLVDENDKIIGQAPRSEVREKALLHRGSVILITNKKNELLMQKRSEKKKVFPGKWAFAAGGGVETGESYEQAAHRELKEELGITTDLKQLFKTRFKSPVQNHFLMSFQGTHEGPFTFPEHEITEIKWMTIPQIDQLISDNLLCEDDIEVTEKFKKQ